MGLSARSSGSRLLLASLLALLCVPSPAEAQLRGRDARLLESERLVALSSQRVILLRGATLLDGAGGPPREDMAVLVRDGRIDQVGRAETFGSMPPGTPVLELEGRWLVPGFVDVRLAPVEPADLRDLLAAGVTAVRIVWPAEDTRGPDLRGGGPRPLVIGEEAAVAAGPASPFREEEAPAGGRRLATPDWGELLAADPARLEAAVGRLLMRDVSLYPGLALLERRLLCGDLLPDPPAGGLSPRGCGEDESRSDDFHERAGGAWPAALDLVLRLHTEGLLLAAGSGVPEAGLKPGAAFHRELRLLVEAGIPPARVFRMATRNGAAVLGILHRAGTVEVGKPADLVLLRGNPLRDIVNTEAVEWVMLGGEVHEPAELRERGE